MLRLIFQELKFRRNAIIGWSIGLCFFPLVYVGIYPQVAEEMVGLADLEIYQAMGISLGTFADWIGSILVLFVPLVAGIYGILNGTGTLAGEEEDGRLEMIVTLPLPRWQIVTAKAIALAISSLLMFIVVGLVSVLVFTSIEGQIETDLVAGDLFSAVMAGWPLTFAIALIALFLAAFTSRRRIASMIATAYLIVSYFGSSLAASTSAIEPFEPLFLYTYLDSSGSAVQNGQAAGDIFILLMIGLVSFGLAIFFFDRRDLTVGSWPWQRRRTA